MARRAPSETYEGRYIYYKPQRQVTFDENGDARSHTRSLIRVARRAGNVPAYVAEHSCEAGLDAAAESKGRTRPQTGDLRTKLRNFPAT
jgi:hypothetical protein